MGRLLLVLLVLCAACSGAPEPGSAEDLTRQLDELKVPESMVRRDDRYEKDCGETCPLLVRWYDVSGSLEAASSALIEGLEAGGLSHNAGAISPNLFSARNETHIFFVVFDEGMLAGNRVAPSGIEAEISVHLLPDDP